MGPSDLPVYEMSELNVFNSLNFGVWIASFAPGASKYIFANTKCTEMLNQSREHMVRSNCCDRPPVCGMGRPAHHVLA